MHKAASATIALTLSLITWLVPMSQGASAAINKICWEAESASQIRKPLRRFRIRQRADYSSRYKTPPSMGYVQMPWVENHLDGVAVYRFRVVNPGRYSVWIRVKWSNSFSNRLYAAVNGSSLRVIGETGNYGFWHWEGGRFFRCHAGTNTLVLRDMDMGIKIDQIFLTSNPNYAPLGVQKVTQ